MNLDDLLDAVTRTRIELSVEGETLRIRAPKGALSEELRRALAEHKGELIRRIARLRRGPGLSEIDPSSQAPGCLSPAQERLWFLSRLAPTSPQYNMHFAVRMEGQLSVEALRTALTEVVRRHEVLRTAILEIDGIPQPFVRPITDFTLDFVALPEPTRGEREQSVDRLSVAQSVEPIDLSRGPLRARLVAVGEEDHALVLTLHHIATDGWSQRIFFQELCALYATFAAGAPSPLQPLPIQYGDYARRQRTELAGDRTKSLQGWWVDRLAGLPRLRIPSDKPIPNRRTPNGARHLFRLAPELNSSLRRLSREEGTTPFVSIFAAFATLLHRYAGQSDFGVGTIVTGRDSTDLEALIGCFINTVLLRCDLSGDPSFKVLLARLKAVAQDAFDHQDLPFDRIVRAVGVARDRDINPLVQVNFNMAPALPSLHVPGMAWRLVAHSPTASPVGTTHFDLGLMLIEERDGGLWGEFNFSTDLFDATRIQRAATHFETLLRGVVADPTQRLSRLPLMTANERELLLEWSGKSTSPIDVRSVHELVEARAARTPEAIAVAFEDHHITYRQLDRSASRIAQRLRALGVDGDSRIGLFIGRSTHMIVGALSVLKTGATYVPLDPNYPRDRIGYMIEDARVSLLLAEHALDRDLPMHRPAAFIEELIAGEGPGDRLAARETRAAGLAYIVYTSGSTGRPKGVLVTHKNLSHYMQAMTSVVGLRPDDVYLHTASIGFSSAVRQTFLPLTVGCKVVIASPTALHDPTELFETILRHGVTVIDIVPTHWRACVQALRAVDGDTRERLLANRLRLIMSASEALPSDVPDAWAGFGHPAEYMNMFGQTETTGIVTTHRYSVPCASLARIVPIGRPIPGVHVYVLDAELEPVPTGITGEIYVGGPTVALGYNELPTLTTERFVRSPFSTDNGDDSRLYRTGDLGRFRTDGTLEFVGRADDQIKIRGFRIEPDEVQAALKRQPSVRDVVVIAREDTPGERRLVAYVVPDTGASSSPAELRESLMALLPDYMVPQAFVTMRTLPVSANGKIDPSALPNPDEVVPGSPEAAPPSACGPIERTVAEIWRQVLKTDAVGPGDDFFALGGDSMLVLQAVWKARQAGLVITPRDIYQSATVAGVARLARPVQAPIDQGPATGTVPLTPIQRRFFESQSADSHDYDLLMLLEARRPLEQAPLEEGVRHLMEHHDALRLRFHHDGREWQQALSPSDSVSTEILFVHLPPVDEDGQRALIEATCVEARASLDISRGPLFRVALFDSGSRKPQLLAILIHHLVVDAVSLHTLLTDLETVLDQLARNESIHLTKTSSFQQWAEYLTTEATSKVTQGELSYWLDERRRNVKPLPRDYPERSNSTEGLKSIALSLDPGETRAFLLQAPQVFGCEVNDLLMAALGRSIGSWTGERSFLCRTSNHGRDEIRGGLDFSRTVGWLACVFPVFLELESTDLSQLLRSVRKQLREVPRRGIGHGLLRYLGERAIQQSLALLPEPEFSFNYLGRLGSTFDRSASLVPATNVRDPIRVHRGRRAELLDVIGVVDEERLRFSWTYSENVHRRSTVETVAVAFVDSLRELTNCNNRQAGAEGP